MDEEITLTAQEVRALVLILLDAVDVAEGVQVFSAAWSDPVFEWCYELLDRLYRERYP